MKFKQLNPKSPMMGPEDLARADLTSPDPPEPGGAKLKTLLVFLIAVIFTLLYVPARAQLAAAAWPKFQGDLGNTGQAVGTGALPFVKWQTTTPLDGSIPPLIGPDGTVYVCSFDDDTQPFEPVPSDVSAFSPSGALEWTAQMNDMIVASPVLASNGTLYVPTSGGIHPFNSANGAAVLPYAFPIDYPSAPTIGPDGTLFVCGGSGNGALEALSPSTGSAIWTSQLPAGVRISGGPAIGANGLIYAVGIAVSSFSVYGFDPSTGIVQWVSSSVPINQFGGEQYAYSTPPVIGPSGTVYVGDNDAGVCAFDGVTGALKWSTPVGGGVATPSVAADGTVYVCAYHYDSFDGSSDGVFAFDGETGEQKWVFSPLMPSGGHPDEFQLPAAIGSDGTVYACGNSGNVYSVSGVDGSLNWSYPITQILGNPAGMSIGPDGTLYSYVWNDRDSPQLSYLTAFAAGIQVSVAPNPVSAGAQATGTLTIPVGTLTSYVGLSSSSPNVTVPPSVLFPYQATTETFPVTTAPSMSAYSARITANFLGTIGTWIVNVSPEAGDGISQVTLDPNGSAVAGPLGFVTLTSPAPPGGWLVNLVSSDPAVLSVPSTVTVNGGFSVAAFPLTIAPQGKNVTVTVTASDTTSSKKAKVTLLGREVSGVSVAPNPVAGGQSATGTLTLNNPAPDAGWVVNLVSANPSLVGVPTSVTVPAGATTASFSVSTALQGANASVAIVASDQFVQKQTTLKVLGEELQKLDIAPNPVAGGQSATGTVTLTNPAPSGGWTVNLVSANPTLVGVPNSVTVPSGSTTTTFTVSTTLQGPNASVVVAASDAFVQKQTNLKVLGVQVSNLTLSPTSVVGGQSSTGTVTLSNPAPAGGWVVNLVSVNTALATVPSSMTIPAGSTTATFTVTTVVTTQSGNSQIQASDAFSQQNATLKVTKS